jgi:hypothetical protein
MSFICIIKIGDEAHRDGLSPTRTLARSGSQPRQSER